MTANHFYYHGMPACMNTNTKVYMYFNDVPVVTSAPVPYPTLQPVQPSRRPSPAPTVYVAPELFAVVGGTSCAETLYYGPQYISTSGSGDGQYPYFLSTSTYSKNVRTQPPMITLQATQQVDGVSFDAYSANTLAFNTVFKATIAATVTGISVNDITYMAALPVNRRRSLAEVVGGVVGGVVDSVVSRVEGSTGADEGQEERHIDPSTATTLTTPATTITTTSTAITASINSNLRAGAKQTASSSINLDYTISVLVGSGTTYDTMSSQLKDSVNNNQFTTRLQQFASEQNVTELNGASSSSIETQNTTPNNDSSKSGSTFTLPMIVGIAVGGCALFVFIIYSWFWCLSRRAPQPGGGPFPRLDTLQNQASAPPMVNDPALSKDINAYFYGDSAHSTSASHRGNQIVSTDHEAAELGGAGLGLGAGQGANEGYSHTVDSPHSSHRPHPAVSPHYTESGGSGGSGGSGSSGSGIEMHDMSHHGASPVSKSVSAPLSPTSNHNQTLHHTPIHTPVSARESLPVAALAMAVTVDHSHMAHSQQDHEIAIAEVYMGEAEEYKE